LVQPGRSAASKSSPRPWRASAYEAPRGSVVKSAAVTATTHARGAEGGCRDPQPMNRRRAPLRPFAAVKRTGRRGGRDSGASCRSPSKSPRRLVSTTRWARRIARTDRRSSANLSEDPCAGCLCRVAQLDLTRPASRVRRRSSRLPSVATSRTDMPDPAPTVDRDDLFGRRCDLVRSREHSGRGNLVHCGRECRTGLAWLERGRA
jgi:hypothetical protein